MTAVVPSKRRTLRFAFFLLLAGTMQPGMAHADERLLDQVPDAGSLVDGRYTIQLLALPDRDALEAFVLASGVSGLMAKQIQRNGESHYVLFTGSFADRETAASAADNLPAPLSELTPWIRPLDPLLQ